MCILCSWVWLEQRCRRCASVGGGANGGLARWRWWRFIKLRWICEIVNTAMLLRMMMWWCSLKTKTSIGEAIDRLPDTVTRLRWRSYLYTPLILLLFSFLSPRYIWCTHTHSFHLRWVTLHYSTLSLHALAFYDTAVCSHSRLNVKSSRASTSKLIELNVDEPVDFFYVSCPTHWALSVPTEG